MDANDARHAAIERRASRSADLFRSGSTQKPRQPAAGNITVGKLEVTMNNDVDPDCNEMAAMWLAESIRTLMDKEKKTRTPVDSTEVLEESAFVISGLIGLLMRAITCPDCSARARKQLEATVAAAADNRSYHRH
jgi:hypothetical protein